ncbi:MAG: hypothetical protein PUJ24_08825 [Bacteroidales bacterium]|nr:hypothetical protein [Bacteroidales bacterium]
MSNGLPPVPISAGLKGRTPVIGCIREADVLGRKSINHLLSPNLKFKKGNAKIAVFITIIATIDIVKPWR